MLKLPSADDKNSGIRFSSHERYNIASPRAYEHFYFARPSSNRAKRRLEIARTFYWSRAGTGLLAVEIDSRELSLSLSFSVYRTLAPLAPMGQKCACVFSRFAARRIDTREIIFSLRDMHPLLMRYPRAREVNVRDRRGFHPLGGRSSSFQREKGIAVCGFRFADLEDISGGINFVWAVRGDLSVFLLKTFFFLNE